MLTVDNLHVGYNPGLHILRGGNIIAPPGRATAVLGANGVGKSTLLKAMFGMLKPTQGRILCWASPTARNSLASSPK